MATPEVMNYFNPSLETELIVDASPVGLGAILTQLTAHSLIAKAVTVKPKERPLQ